MLVETGGAAGTTVTVENAGATVTVETGGADGGAADVVTAVVAGG